MDRGLIFRLNMPGQGRFELPDEYTSIPEAANPTCPFCQKKFIHFLDLVDHLRFYTCPNVFDDEVTYFWKAGNEIEILE